MRKHRKDPLSKAKKGVRNMRFDESLLTGLFLGITMGLMYGASLVEFMPFFVLLTLLSLVRYLHSR